MNVAVIPARGGSKRIPRKNIKTFCGKPMIAHEQCDYVFSVTSFSFPIQRALKMLSNGRVKMFSPDCMSARSLDLEEGYHDAGQFYWGRTDTWAGDKPIFESNSVPFFMPRHRVQDIDTPEDWLYAELMYHALMSMHETEQA